MTVVSNPRSYTKPKALFERTFSLCVLEAAAANALFPAARYHHDFKSLNQLDI